MRRKYALNATDVDPVRCSSTFPADDLGGAHVLMSCRTYGKHATVRITVCSDDCCVTEGGRIESESTWPYVVEGNPTSEVDLTEGLRYGLPRTEGVEGTDLDTPEDGDGNAHRI